MSPQNLGQIPKAYLPRYSQRYCMEIRELKVVRFLLFFPFLIFRYMDIKCLFPRRALEYLEKIFPDIFSERNSRQTLSQQQLNHIFSLQYSVRIKIMKIFGFQSPLL